MIFELLILICLLSLLSHIIFTKKTKEYFDYSYNDVRVGVLKNIQNAYQSKIHTTEEELEVVSNGLRNTNNVYNNLLCNTYTPIYRFNSNNYYIEDERTYYKPDMSNAHYDVNSNKCVSSLSGYYPVLTCDERIECINGNVISGRKVIKDFEEMCEYGCQVKL